MVLLHLITQNPLPLVSPASIEPDPDLDCMCSTVYLLTLGLLENVYIPNGLGREREIESAHSTVVVSLEAP